MSTVDLEVFQNEGSAGLQIAFDWEIFLYYSYIRAVNEFIQESEKTEKLIFNEDDWNINNH